MHEYSEINKTTDRYGNCLRNKPLINNNIIKTRNTLYALNKYIYSGIFKDMLKKAFPSL